MRDSSVTFRRVRKSNIFPAVCQSHSCPDGTELDSHGLPGYIRLGTLFAPIETDGRITAQRGFRTIGRHIDWQVLRLSPPPLFMGERSEEGVLLGWVKEIELAGRRVLVGALSLLFRTRATTRLDPTHVHSILLLRQDKLGDYIITTPLIRALRTAFPQARIDLLHSRTNASAVATDPFLDRRLLYDKKHWLRVARLLWRIRKDRYDVIADPWDNVSTTSICVCLLGNPRWAVGFEKGVRVFDVAVPPLRDRAVHIILRILALSGAFGIDPAACDPTPYLHLPEEDRAFAADFRASHPEWDRSHPRIGLNISAGVRTRMWPAERYVEICRRIGEMVPSGRILLLSTPEDRPRLEGIAAATPGLTLPAPVTPSFRQFAALIGECEILVTPDTSAIHVASAFGVPTVALYPKKTEYQAAWHPFGIPSRVVQSDSERDMNSITPAEVAAAFLDLWSDKTK